MGKRFLVIMVLCSVLCFLLAGCSVAATNGSQSAAQSGASTQAGAGSTQKAVEEGQTMQAGDYTTQEIWVSNGGQKIYGVAYVPNGAGKAPLVIFSHELGRDHTSGERYAERLAKAGYAAYVFDFRGGTVGGNRSDGTNKEMSILTEASDLEAVLNAAKTWEFVDASKIVLLGGSMGGLVTTVVGSSHQDEIAGMMLMYPALSAKADSGAERYGQDGEVPEDVSLFGGWIHVGRNYITDLRQADFNQLLSSYRGHMLLIHGDKDATVPISWSEEASKIIPDCEFHVIEGGGHEFFGQPFEDAMSHILAYLGNQLGGQSGSPAQTTAEAAATLQMTIGDTPVNVEWEANDTVAALGNLCQGGPLTIGMSRYGGFEQVGPIGQSLPRNDVQTATKAGDIVLYSGDQLVVFYGSNSWPYTKLGHIAGKSDQELADLLGSGDVTITIAKG